MPTPQRNPEPPADAKTGGAADWLLDPPPVRESPQAAQRPRIADSGLPLPPESPPALSPSPSDRLLIPRMPDGGLPVIGIWVVVTGIVMITFFWQLPTLAIRYPSLNRLGFLLTMHDSLIGVIVGVGTAISGTILICSRRKMK